MSINAFRLFREARSRKLFFGAPILGQLFHVFSGNAVLISPSPKGHWSGKRGRAQLCGLQVQIGLRSSRAETAGFLSAGAYGGPCF